MEEEGLSEELKLIEVSTLFLSLIAQRKEVLNLRNERDLLSHLERIDISERTAIAEHLWGNPSILQNIFDIISAGLEELSGSFDPHRSLLPDQFQLPNISDLVRARLTDIKFPKSKSFDPVTISASVILVAGACFILACAYAVLKAREVTTGINLETSAFKFGIDLEATRTIEQEVSNTLSHD